MASTTEYYQRAVNDYEDRVRDLNADLQFLNSQVADAARVLAELRAQRSSVEPGSPEQALLLEQINNTARRRNELEARQADTFNALQSAQSSLQQAQSDLNRVSQGDTNITAPPTPTVSNADPAAEIADDTQGDIFTDNDFPDVFSPEPPDDDPVSILDEDIEDLEGEPIQPDPDPLAPNLSPYGEENEFEIPEDELDRGDEAVFDDPQSGGFVYNDDGELIPADSAEAEFLIQERERVENVAPEPVPGNYVVSYNVETGTYDVIDQDTGDTVASNLSEQDATLFAQDANTVGIDEAAAEATNRDFDQQEALDAAASAANIQGRVEQARNQQAINSQNGQNNNGDWRVKLRLAAGADYLYRDPELTQDGILYPLSVTNGVVFPYTPTISTNYGANYSSYDLTHSNYRGYFYQNSYIDEISVTATFTAQDTFEANYLLAVIHFFRSVTRMFYGQDSNRGMPPPLTFLEGLGQFQFNLHPCVVKNFQYNLPADVDYIRARTANINGTNLLQRRDRQTLPVNSGFLSNIRLGNAGINPGAIQPRPAPPTLGLDNPTYVPTKIEIAITLLPIQSRSQVSQQFSVRQYANGDLLKGGFW